MPEQGGTEGRSQVGPVPVVQQPQRIDRAAGEISVDRKPLFRAEVLRDLCVERVENLRSRRYRVGTLSARSDQAAPPPPPIESPMGQIRPSCRCADDGWSAISCGPAIAAQRIGEECQEETHARQQTSRRAFPAVSFGYLSVECPFNKLRNCSIASFIGGGRSPHQSITRRIASSTVRSIYSIAISR